MYNLFSKAQRSMMTKIFTYFICLSFLFVSCKKSIDTTKEVEAAAANDSIHLKSEESEIKTKFVPQSTDEQTAQNIKTFLTQDYLKDDLSFLQPVDRKFQFYKIDLNEDGNEEIFVRLSGPYFCGSGGCTFLLLDKYGAIITKFTVTRAPIFVEPSKVNGWSLLLVKDAGVFKELTFDQGSYPSNPSVLPKAPYDAPSGHAQVMFDNDLYVSKTFDF